MKLILDILRGMIIGLANLIPGVSGGTMMVAMGIYDTLIHCINNLFREFKKSVLTLLPYAVGMVAAIALGAFGLKAAFGNWPLPTNFLFIGLILGSVPMILKQIRGEKIGPAGGIAFVLFFSLVVVLKAIEGENRAALGTDFLSIVKYLLLGGLSSSTMVIPGVSGSMLLKTLGYYEPIVTETLTGFLSALMKGDWAVVGHGVLILLPFLVGIVVGIFAIAKLIGMLLKKWKGPTYCAILGMVTASPVAILMDRGIYTKGTGLPVILACAVTFAAGLAVALILGREPGEAVKE